MSLADETALLWEEVDNDAPSLAAAGSAAWAVEGPVDNPPHTGHIKIGGTRKPKRVFSKTGAAVKRAVLRESSEVLLDIADRVPFTCVKSHSEHVSFPSPAKMLPRWRDLLGDRLVVGSRIRRWDISREGGSSQAPGRGHAPGCCANAQTRGHIKTEDRMVPPVPPSWAVTGCRYYRPVLPAAPSR